MAVIVQPGTKLVTSVQGHRDWESGVFGCFGDCKSMLCSVCCLPLAVSRIASRSGDCCCMPCFVPGALLAMRTRIRTLGGIEGSICNDFLVLSVCGLCAICQMQRELDAMGL